VQCGTKERAVAPAASGYAELGNATQQREEQAQQQGEQAQPSVSGRKAPAAIRATRECFDTGKTFHTSQLLLLLPPSLA